MSFDTTRADAVSAYDRVADVTPNLDRLAREGVRFDWAIAPAPTTLCSHASVFTGLDSHGHGVVANGFPIDDSLPLLAERFQNAGWETMAVLGSSALEERMGLDRGFRAYDDDLSIHSGPRYEDPAKGVVERALHAVDGRDPSKPLFLFVHFFDAHGPWNSASPELRAQHVDPTYVGPVHGEREGTEVLITAVRYGQARPEDIEHGKQLYRSDVAAADEGLGLLLQGLTERRLLEDAFVVVFGDHGESFDEQPDRAFGHGFDVDLYVTHVPLVVYGTGKLAVPAGEKVERAVRLQDVGATALAAAGIPGTLGAAVDLSPTWKGGTVAEVPIFSEATKPREKQSSTSWNNLPMERAVVHEGHVLTKCPWLGEPGRLFRLDWDQTPVDDPAMAAKLDALLQTWDEKVPPFRDDRMGASTLQALRSLGYVE